MHIHGFAPQRLSDDRFRLPVLRAPQLTRGRRLFSQEQSSYSEDLPSSTLPVSVRLAATEPTRTRGANEYLDPEFRESLPPPLVSQRSRCKPSRCRIALLYARVSPLWARRKSFPAATVIAIVDAGGIVALGLGTLHSLQPSPASAAGRAGARSDLAMNGRPAEPL